MKTKFTCDQCGKLHDASDSHIMGVKTIFCGACKKEFEKELDMMYLNITESEACCG